MTLAAVLLAVLAVVLTEPVPRWLAGASWPARAPRAALVLWQSVGLAAGLAAVGACLLYGAAPGAGDLPAAVAALWDSAAAGRPFDGLRADHVLALVAGALLAGRLLGVLLLDGARTLRQRRRHRQLLDLVGTPWPDAPWSDAPWSEHARAVVVDHPTAVAYCLPGLRRPRVVVSAGTLSLLDSAELRAVLAHERAHLAERHDLVVLPFGAWAAAFPFVPGVRRASAAVATLVEMLADDRARARCDRRSLATAIARVGSAGTPAGALPASGSAVLARVERLLDPPLPAPLAVKVAACAAAVALLTAPTVFLLLLPAL